MIRQLKERALGPMAFALIWTAAVAFPSTVAAKQGDVIRTGSCSASSDWKLKLSPDDGKIEVEFEVDSNVNGQTWNVRLQRNGDTFFTGSRMTHAPGGFFEVRKLATNGFGTDSFVARAVNSATGEVCRGKASI